MNIAEMYTGMRAIPQSGSGLSLLSILFFNVAFDMGFMNDFHYLK